MGTIIHAIDDALYLILDYVLLFYIAFSLYKFRFSESFSGKFLKVQTLLTALIMAVCYRLLTSVVDYLGVLTHELYANVRTTDDILRFGETPLQYLSLIFYGLIVVFLFTKRHRIHALLLVTLFLPICDMLRIISYYLSRLLPDLWNGELIFGARMFLSVFFLLVFAFFAEKYFKMLLSSQKKSYLIYTGVASFFLNLLLLLIKRRVSEISLAAFAFALIMLVILLFFLLIEKLAQNYNNTLRLEYQKKIEEYDRHTILEMESATEEIRKWRHEYQNQLLLLKSYVEEGRIPELEQTLNGLLDNIPKIERLIHTGNQELDMILNHKMTEAKKKGIDFQAQISVPENLPFDRKDLFSLLNNLLNNAIEASEKALEPYIQLTINPFKGYLLIQIRNTCLGYLLDQNPDLKTQKEKPFLHGMGLSLIRSIAEKYSGIAYFSQKGDLFESKVMLSLNQLSPQ